MKININKYYHRAKSIMGLSLSLAKVRFKLRNEGSYLGIFWYLLNPLVMFYLLLFLGKVINKTNIEHYPAYLLLGLVMFNIFTQATNSANSAISGNSGYIKSMKINQEPFVIAGILQPVFSHFFEIAILIILFLYLKISLIGLLFYPIILFFLLLFIAGFSFILATIGTYISDIANVWSVVVNLSWFAAPVYYVVSKGQIPLFNKINPMFYFITNAREIVIYNTVPDLNMLLIMVAFSLGSFVLGILIFEKFKNRFAEII